MTEETDFPSEIDNNKNKNTIRCQFCDSIILKAKSANYSENEVSSINIHTFSAYVDFSCVPVIKVVNTDMSTFYYSIRSVLIRGSIIAFFVFIYSSICR